MNIVKNIRFQQSIIENAKQQIDNEMAEIVSNVNNLPNIKAHTYGTRLAITRTGTPSLSAVISLEKYDSMDDLVKDIANWNFPNRTYELTEFDHLQGLLLQLQGVQTSLRTQLQKIVDEYDNKNPQLFIEVRDGGISLTHRNHQVESSKFVNACDITSKDKFHEIVNRFLNKF